MINNKEEAIDHCRKNGIKISSHKSVIVTSNGSIYIDTEISDDSQSLFIIKGKGSDKIQDSKKEEVKTKSSKKLKDGTTDNII